MNLPYELIHAPKLAEFRHLRFDMSPVQLGLCASPWHVAVASISRERPSILARLFERWPTPTLLSASDTELENVLPDTSRTKIRYIQRLCFRWDVATWFDLRDLTGVSFYVAAAVALYCFGNTDEADCDEEFANIIPLNRMNDPYTVNGIQYRTIEGAYSGFTRMGIVHIHA